MHRYRFVAAAALSCFLSASAEATMVGYFKLDESALPTAVNQAGANGSYNNFATSELGQAASPGYAAGSSVRFLVPASDATTYQSIDLGELITGSSAVTISMWAKFANTTADHTLMSKGSFTTGQPLLFWRDDSDGGNLGGGSDTLGVIVGNARAVGAPSSVTNTDWHHVAFTYETGSTDGLKIYLDGQRTIGAGGSGGNNIIDTTSLPAIGGAGTSLRIGYPAAGAPTDKEMHGLIDEVAIYTDALSASDIAFIFNGGDPTAVPEPAGLAVVGIVAAGLLRRRRR